MQIVREEDQRLAVEKLRDELHQGIEDAFAAKTLVLDSSARAVVEVGKDIAEVGELSRVQSVERRDTLVGALAHERDDRLAGEVIGAKRFLPLARKLHHGERMVANEAPSNGLDDRRLPHPRSAFNQEESRLAHAQGFERFGERL